MIGIQYSYIQSARIVLLDYCKSIATSDLIKPVPAFNERTMHDLLLHCANVYVFWIGNFGLGKSLPFYSPPDHTINIIRSIYTEVDSIMQEFIDHIKDPHQLIEGFIPSKNRKVQTTALQLFTHGVTHEFHHKGQILTMSRILGYIPPDTDVIRFP